MTSSEIESELHMKKGDTKYVYVVRHFKPWDWVVFFSMSDHDVHQAETQIKNATIGIASICSLLSILLIMIIFKKFIVGPIRDIAKAASAITDGQNIKKIDVMSKDELGELARNMEYMSQAIHKYKIEREQVEKLLLEKQEEIQLHHDSMEQLVEDRTFELNETNKMLEQEIIDRKQEEEKKQKLERKLQQSQKMESIGQLAGGIAHDFNNVLYPIIGFTQMSMEELDKNHPVHENLQDILDGAKRARDLVKQILLFSRQKEQVLKPIILKPVIEEAIKLLRSSIPTNIDI